MKSKPIVIETTINAPIDKVWQAITDKNQMREWYFTVEKFKPEAGFEFKVVGEKDGKQYPTTCKITKVIPRKKLAHTWSFDEFPTHSLVTWELFEEADQTTVRLTHEGLENMPADHPEASPENHREGWKYIIGTSLKGFLEK